MKYQQVILSGIVLFIAVQLPLVTAYAQAASSSASKTPAAPSRSAKEVAAYQLPYPGMLPDNPLYFLKVVRDDLTAFFIGKPLAKASFDLLQSDKDVEASYLLVTREQGKETLALQTFSQSQDYFVDAIKQVKSAKKQGYSILEISKKLQASAQKHEQMLQSVGQQTHQQNSSTFKRELVREKALSNMAKVL